MEGAWQRIEDGSVAADSLVVIDGNLYPRSPARDIRS